MNTDDKLLQILDDSACLSKGQLTGYLKHTLYPEELRAVELHLSSCALCNEALEGLEQQQDVERLLAGMIPPVLPAIVPKEKPKEKKEVPTTAKPEKTEPAMGLRHGAPIRNEYDSKANDTSAARSGSSWGRPAGIAAVLLLGFGALWYFEFKRDTPNNAIGEKMASVTNAPDTAMAALQRAAADTLQASARDSAMKLAEKKHADSLFLARREEQRKEARRDSLLALQMQDDSGRSGKSIAMKSPGMAASKVAEVTPQADQEDQATKAAASSPAKLKDEGKKVLSDFEQGLKKYKEKNYASALLYFRPAEDDEDDPKHWEAVYYSGLCNRYLNKNRRARKLFERVIDANAPQKKSAQRQLDDMKNGD